MKKRIYLHAFAFGLLGIWVLNAVVLLWAVTGVSLLRLVILGNLLAAAAVYLDDCETD